MKKRILSLVLCAAMLLSMCLFLGAGVMDDTTADGSAESTESYIPAVNFTNVAPFVQANAQAANSPARAPLRAGANAAATQAADNGVVTSKTATANDDGTYTITLTSYTTGDVKQLQTTKPTDIVLVLDVSGSMDFCMECGGENGYHKTFNIDQSKKYYIKDGSDYLKVEYCQGKSWPDWHSAGWYYSDYNHTVNFTPKTAENSNGTQFYEYNANYTSRLSALKHAASNFVDQVAKQTKTNDGSTINHRIAVVSFQSTSKNITNGFVSMDDANGSTTVKDKIDALSADGGTRIDLGIQEANKIFENNPINGEDRNRVMVVFTDGAPGKYGNWQSQSVATANAAIEGAYTTKNTYNATVYTIGVFSGADATGALPEYTEYTYNYGFEVSPSDADQIKNSNRFMHLVSSEYLHATDIETPGARNPGVKDDGYYLSAGNEKALEEIFQKISSNISSPSIELGDEAYVKDTVSPYFTAPKDSGEITVYAEKANPDGSGGYSWEDDKAYNASTKMNVEVKGQAVTVSGFDYDANFVSQTARNENDSTSTEDCDFYGRRLVISFKVQPKDDFLGGNNVYTNDSAGVYVDSAAETPLLTFDRPTVNVPIKKVSVTAADKNVYLLGDLTAAELKNGATVKVGDVSLDLSQANYGLKAWQTDYVNIEVTITDGAGKVVSTAGLSGLKDDTTYTVTVKVSPNETETETSSGAAATERTGSSNKANVNVYKPVLTYKDSEVYYGEAVPTSYTSNLESTVWKHGDTAAPASMGTAPTLTPTYTPEADKIAGDKINTRTDVGVAVAVMINETPVTDSVRFKHTDCAGTTCTVPADCKFVLHVNTCSLTISKTVKGDGANPNPNQNQTFVFNVKDSTDKVVTTIVLKAGESKKITGLPVGMYTVEEDTNWSWSYTAVSGNNTKVTLSSARDSGTVGVTNKYNKPNWLTSFAEVINKWITKGDKTTINQENIWPKN